LIRRISDLGLGTTATPLIKPDSSGDYFDVSGGSTRQGGGEFTGLGWRFRPASGGGYNRPRVAITPGPCSKVALWLGHASMQSTEIYLRADPTEKLEALAAMSPPGLQRGRFRAPDKLMAMLKVSGRS
jgi:hypothetical protein